MSSAQITPTNAQQQQLVNQKSPTAAISPSGRHVSRFFASTSSSYGHEDLSRIAQNASHSNNNNNNSNNQTQNHGAQGPNNPHLSAYQQQQLSQSLNHNQSQGSGTSPKNTLSNNNGQTVGKPPAQPHQQQPAQQQQGPQANHHRVPSLSRQVGHSVGLAAAGSQQHQQPFSPTAAHQQSTGQYQQQYQVCMHTCFVIFSISIAVLTWKCTTERQLICTTSPGQRPLFYLPESPHSAAAAAAVHSTAEWWWK